jgi:hypothetical protein
VPRKLGRELVGHEVRTVPQLGWSGTKNGELLRRAALENFGVLVTADQNLEYQQDVSKVAIGVVVLAARSNRFIHLKALVPRLLLELESLEPGTVVRVVAPS